MDASYLANIRTTKNENYTKMLKVLNMQRIILRVFI